MEEEAEEPIARIETEILLLNPPKVGLPFNPNWGFDKKFNPELKEEICMVREAMDICLKLILEYENAGIF